MEDELTFQKMEDEFSLNQEKLLSEMDDSELAELAIWFKEHDSENKG